MRVLLTTFGSFGDVNPYLALGRELCTRGHEATLAAPASYRAAVERAGLRFHPVRPDADLEDRAVLEQVMHPRTGIVFLIEELLLPALRESYEDLAAVADGQDVLVTHPLTYAGHVLGEAAGITWASTALSPLPFMSTHDAPILSPLRSLAWLRHLGRWPNAALFRLGRLAVRKWEVPIRELRASVGLPPGRSPFYEGQFSPAATLALFSPLLGPVQPDWPPHVVQPGFATYDGSHGQEGLSEELERFLDTGDPPVVFTLGSSAVTAGRAFYEAGVAAARGLGRRAVLVGEHEVAPDDSGVLHVDAAPYGALFPRASVVVHPGGIGTVARTLLAGRPSLVVPVAHDQPDNGARLARLGVARTLRPRRCTVAHFTRELERLHAPEWALRAAEVARQVRAEPGAQGACEALEELHGTSRP
jgi:UDP:flavonoid glycosyltransferase YjiC (YdhE family)